MAAPGPTPHQAEATARIKAALLRDRARVTDMFNSWDADGSGEINRDEFGMALEMLGLEARAALVLASAPHRFLCRVRDVDGPRAHARQRRRWWARSSPSSTRMARAQ